MAYKVTKKVCDCIVDGTTYCEIIADTEADISGLGETVNDDGNLFIPAAGSIAYTADMSAVYQYSPSGMWTKVV